MCEPSAFPAFYSRLDAYLSEYNSRMTYRKNEPLSSYSSMKTGGIGEAVVFPATAEDVSSLLTWIRETGVPYTVFGRGSNTLFCSGLLKRIFLCTRNLSYIRIDGELVTAGAGTPLPLFCRRMADFGYSGLEPLYGIPGSIGGAVYMNAGAFSGNISDCLVTTTFLCGDKYEEIQTYNKAEQEFAYRYSCYQIWRVPPVILEAVFRFPRREPAEIRRDMEVYLSRRKQTQPYGEPNLGSIFRRPPEGPAALYIDRAGWKGKAIGDAAVSEKHAGFFVNRGSATPEDILSLLEAIQLDIFSRFGVRLEPEIQIVR